MTRSGLFRGARLSPTALALAGTRRLQVACAGYGIVVGGALSIGRVGYPGVAADIEGVRRTLLGERHPDSLALQLQLAEALAEQLGRDVVVLLADLHIETLHLAMSDTDFGWGQARRVGQEEQERTYVRTPLQTGTTLARGLAPHRQGPYWSAGFHTLVTQMLQEIFAYLIGGPLGTGKTSLIRSLLVQKPAGERWAVPVNELDEIGLDVVLLVMDVDGVAIGEVVSGCLCCVNGMSFQVGLDHSSRQARPGRLFIEPFGSGHPLALQEQLQAPPWLGILALQPLVVVLDVATLTSGRPLLEAQEQALEATGMLLLNKSETLDATQRCAVHTRLSVLPLRWNVHGHLVLRNLPASAAGESSATIQAALPDALAQLGMMLPIERPLRTMHEQSGQLAIGWRLAPSVHLDRVVVDTWLSRLSRLWRAKVVLHCVDGWYAANAAPFVDNWGEFSWRRDNRLELILAADADEETLEEAFLACRMVAE